MFDHILLEEDQKELLIRFVEAERSVPKGQRTRFLALQTMGRITAEFIHIGSQNLRFDGSLTDADILASRGLLGKSYGRKGTPQFYVLPEGFRYYEEMMKSDRPAEHTEELIRNLIESNEFKDKYPEAYKKWASSEELLWKSDSQDQLTTIGHLCREAIQEFSEVLALDFNLQDELPEKSKTKTRIRRVLEARAEKLSNSEKAWLSSLIDYWKAVSDLIQKQEHGAMREGKELVWEDARRVVFSTLIVMYEIHKSLCQD